MSKDRLYVEGADSLERRSARTAMWEVLSALTRMLAPILSFTAEEIWQEMRTLDASLPESVFLSDFPAVDPSRIDEGLNDLWQDALLLRGAVSRMLEGLRAAKTIGTSLEAAVQVKRNSAMERVAGAFSEQELADLVIVSRFEWTDALDLGTPIRDEVTGLEMAAGFTPGVKCPRCWKYTEDAAGDGLCPRCAAVLKVGN